MRLEHIVQSDVGAVTCHLTERESTTMPVLEDVQRRAGVGPKCG